MRRALVWCVCWWVGLAGAGESSLMFSDVKFSELAKVVLGDVLKRGFVLDAEVTADAVPVTVHAERLTERECESLLVSLSESRGYALVKESGYWRMRKGKPEVKPEQFFYRPRHRTVSYLSEQLAPLFPSGSFSFQQRGMASVPQAPLVAGGAVESRAPSAVVTNGKVAGVAREDVESFFFEGSRTDIDRLSAALDLLDVKPREVVIRAAIYEVSTIKSDATAIGIVADLLGGKLGFSMGSVAPGAWSASLSTSAFSAVVKVLASDTRFKSIARPEIRVLSGGQGRVQVGDETPILGAVRTEQSGAQTQSIEYRPSGVLLTVSPVVQDEIIDLSIAAQSSSFVRTTTGVDQSPTLLKRELQTRVAVVPETLVVLGGLQNRSEGDDVSGWRFLPDWLKTKSKNQNDTELVLVLYVEKV